MNKGFTLVELMIATALLMSLTGFGTAKYLDFNEKQVLEQAGKDLKNHLRLAQKKALSGEKDTAACGTDKPLDGWCFTTNSSPEFRSEFPDKEYGIYGHCGGETVADTGRFKTQTFDLPSGVSLTVSPDEKLLFGALSQGADREITYCLSAGTFLSLGGQVYRIKVMPGGEIIDEGFKASCTAP